MRIKYVLIRSSLDISRDDQDWDNFGDFEGAEEDAGDGLDMDADMTTTNIAALLATAAFLEDLPDTRDSTELADEVGDHDAASEGRAEDGEVLDSSAVAGSDAQEEDTDPVEDQQGMVFMKRFGISASVLNTCKSTVGRMIKSCTCTRAS